MSPRCCNVPKRLAGTLLTVVLRHTCCPVVGTDQMSINVTVCLSRKCWIQAMMLWHEYSERKGLEMLQMRIASPAEHLAAAQAQRCPWHC